MRPIHQPPFKPIQRRLCEAPGGSRSPEEIMRRYRTEAQLLMKFLQKARPLAKAGGIGAIKQAFRKR